MLILLPLAGQAQQACQPLQGTAAHATCLNQELARTGSALQALERQAVEGKLPDGFAAPDLLSSARETVPPLAGDPAFGSARAADRLRLEQSTRSRGQALSGRVGRSLSPRLPGPGS